MDSATYSIDKQFLVGAAFLVTPVIEEKKQALKDISQLVIGTAITMVILLPMMKTKVLD